MTSASAKELANHTGAILERVRRGERVRIRHRGKIVAEIVPLKPAEASEDEEKQRLLAAERLRGCLKGRGEGTAQFMKNKVSEKAKEEKRWRK